MRSVPPISVIIVNYNGTELLTHCVNSVLTSTSPVLIYVVDNASTDDSLIQLQQKYPAEPRLHIIKNSTNQGFAKAANQALSHITSPYILFLNPDCLLTADCIMQFYTCMEQHPQAGMAGCLIKNPDGTEQAGCRRHIPTPWRSFVQTLHLDLLFPNQIQNYLFARQPLPSQPLPIEGISGACMFVRKTALEEVGPMEESYFLHCEDLDWFIRFQRHNWQILFIPSIEIIHIKGVCSRQQPYRVLWYKHRNMLRLYRKFFHYPWWTWLTIFTAVWTRFLLLSLSTFFSRLTTSFLQRP